MLNGLTTERHRFIADDVMTVLPRLARKGEKFDVIILDPPTFARSPGGKTFHADNDFEKLLTQNNTIIVKCFLHISKAEQEERLLAREKDRLSLEERDPRYLAERQIHRARALQ